MKKLYFVLFSLAALAINAQYSITATNIPVPGNTFDYHKVDTASISGGGAAGSGVTWNFTSIVSDPVILSKSYVNPSATPDSAAFSSSSVAEVTTQQTNYFSGTTNYQMNGMVFLDPSFTATVTLSDAGLIFNSFPFGYGSTNYDTLVGTVQTSQGNGTIDGGITATVDGSGTLNLPGGMTFNNVIRFKMISNLNVSLMGGLFQTTIQEIRYQFYSAVDKFPIFETGTINFGGTIEEYANIADFAYVGINENKGISFNLFPNPAKDELNIRLNNNSGVSKLEILNQLGQVVKAETISATQNATVDLSSISSGIYFVRIQSGNDTHTEKLVIE